MTGYSPGPQEPETSKTAAPPQFPQARTVMDWVRADRKRSSEVIGCAAIGVVCTIIVLIIDAAAHFGAGGITVSLGQASQLCNSTLGTVAQAFSGTASSDCGTVSTVMTVHGFFKFIAWLGFIASAFWIALPYARARQARLNHRVPPQHRGQQ